MRLGRSDGTLPEMASASPVMPRVKALCARRPIPSKSCSRFFGLTICRTNRVTQSYECMYYVFFLDKKSVLINLNAFVVGEIND